EAKAGFAPLFGTCLPFQGPFQGGRTTCEAAPGCATADGAAAAEGEAGAEGGAEGGADAGADAGAGG
ncbi:MAG: hypothetical protein VX699_02140, partial [Myxococcota bacterium]|nr:hypothetical protein [Myxococcota bacterium]